MDLYDKFLEDIKQGIADRGFSQERFAYEIYTTPQSLCAFLRRRTINKRKIEMILEYFKCYDEGRVDDFYIKYGD